MRYDLRKKTRNEKQHRKTPSQILGKKKLMINLGIVRPFLAPEQPAKTYFVVKLQWFSLLLPSSFFLCYRYAADLKSNAEFGTGSHNHIQIK